uniref:Uncharacterized protein n=1 Tax=Ananas comosus var. bracteatus TaxID=296719 RepID=A0A6V7P2A3_ANACO|nr:unnamed protein product [Ananas comosus var. bracteatus]
MAFHLVCFFLQLLLLTTFLNFSFGRHFNVTSSRKAIEIGIGIGIGGGGGGGGGGGVSPSLPDRAVPVPLPRLPLHSQRADNTGLLSERSAVQRLPHAAEPRKHADGRLRRLQRIPARRPHRLRIRRPVARPRALPRQLQQLRGTVPDLSGLRFFYELDVSNNKLTGAFPADVLSLNNATFLDLRFNGPFPEQQQLHGAAPADLGLTPAQYLTLANNKFAGPIPSSIGQAANTLLEVLFLNNLLSGCLPYEIGLLKKATVFDAGRTC